MSATSQAVTVLAPSPTDEEILDEVRRERHPACVYSEWACDAAYEEDTIPPPPRPPSDPEGLLAPRSSKTPT